MRHNYRPESNETLEVLRKPLDPATLIHVYMDDLPDLQQYDAAHELLEVPLGIGIGDEFSPVITAQSALMNQMNNSWLRGILDRRELQTIEREALKTGVNEACKRAVGFGSVPSGEIPGIVDHAKISLAAIENKLRPSRESLISLGSAVLEPLNYTNNRSVRRKAIQAFSLVRWFNKRRIDSSIRKYDI